MSDEKMRKEDTSGGYDGGRKENNSSNRRENDNASSMGPAVDESQKEKLEKEYREDWLSEQLKRKLENIRQAVSRLFKDYNNSIPLGGFTPHDKTHCEAVEKLIYQLLPERCYRGLREYERFLLLASAWLHDIGMIRGIFDECDQKRSDHQIRSKHHERSEIFIVNRPTQFGVEETDAAVLGLLARLHGTSLDGIPEALNVNGVNVRVRLLAAYLCLADALHIDTSRAPQDQYAICLAFNAPVSSKIHWIKSRFVSGININARQNTIELQFKVPAPSQAIELAEKFDVAKITRIHDIVIEEITHYLSDVEKELEKGNITSFHPPIIKTTVPMLLDKQVCRDLEQIVKNPDFMTDPSSSRLAYLILQTIADMLNLGGKKGIESLNSRADIEEQIKRIERDLEPVDLEEQIKQRQRVLELLQIINDNVLEERPCHLDLDRLEKELRERTENAIKHLKELQNTYKQPGYCSDCKGNCSGFHSKTDKKETEFSRELDELEKFIISELHKRQLMRREVRLIGRHYFEHFIKENPKQGDTSSPWGDIPSIPVSILLFGYSELVIKALCGFRDAVIEKLLRAYIDPINQYGYCEEAGKREGWPFKLDLRQPYHHIDFECVASAHFRLFVCTGEPKTQTNSKGQLSFHDGYRYAEALHEHGFTNIVLVPDIAAVGNLLHRTVNGPSTMDRQSDNKETTNSNPMIDLIMLGVNGIERDRFLHGTGHLGISTAVAALSAFYPSSQPSGSRCNRLPRLVFVATKSKFGDKNDDKAKECPVNERWTWLDTNCYEREGYWIQQGFCNERVRDHVFVARDQNMQKFFFENHIRLYNPREDDVWFALVDDVIVDKGFFYGEDRKEMAGIRQEDKRKGKIYKLETKLGTIQELKDEELHNLENFRDRLYKG